MNRGFKVYFKEGLKALKGFLTKKTNLLSYYFYYYVFIFAKMCPFFAPLADLSLIKMTRMIRDEHTISVTRSFYASNSPKNYWTLFVAGLLKSFIVSAIFSLIFAVGVILAMAGTGIGFLLDIDYWFIIPIVLVLPVIVYSIYVTIVLPFRHVPNAYIIDFNNNLGASEVVHASFRAMKERGKITLFASYFVESLFAQIYVIFTAAVVGVSLFLLYENEYLINILVFEGIFLILGLLLYAPVVNIIFSVFRLSLFEDVCAAHITGPVKVTGVNLKKINVVDKEVTVNEMLEDLFDAEVIEDKKHSDKPKTNAVNRVEAFNKAVTNTKPTIKPVVKQEVVKEVKVKKETKPVQPKVKESKVVTKSQPKPTPVVKTTVKPTSQVVRTTVKKTAKPASKPVNNIFDSVDPIATMKPINEKITPITNEKLIDNNVQDVNIFESIDTKETVLATPVVEVVEEKVETLSENITEVVEPLIEEVLEEIEEESVLEDSVLEEIEEVNETVEEELVLEEIEEEPVQEDSVLEEIEEINETVEEESVTEEALTVDVLDEVIQEEKTVLEEAPEMVEEPENEDTPVLEEIVEPVQPVIEEAPTVEVVEEVNDVFSTNSTSSDVKDMFTSSNTSTPNSNPVDMGFGSSLSDDIFGMGTVSKKTAQPKTSKTKAKPIIVKTVKKN